ncbi:glycosyltransferase [Proteiniclasticum sp. C24MP]|uniref:glycosyltransferase n=1 Tax=Proteiniclasticum sp. C24MP TaxID=3374101 RepID=UPI003753F826
MKVLINMKEVFVIYNEILYIAFIYLSETDGIAKKVLSQARGFSKSMQKCSLLCCEDDSIVHLEIINGEIVNKTIKSRLNQVGSNSKERIMTIKELIEVANALIKNEKMLIYIRHMIPTVSHIRFLKNAKLSGHKIGYEIPTYPYYYEQFHVAHNKMKAIIKICNDIIHWPLIYKYVDNIYTIMSNSNSKVYKKMYLIKNGVEINTKIKFTEKKNEDKFNLIGVGTIWPYHGYDRVIDAIMESKGKLENGLDIYFHVVGESDEISKLERYCKLNNLTGHVIFHGKKFGNDLNELYNISHIGVGTLALNKRNADIDTAIKNIEYLSKSLPIVTSGKIFDISEDSNLYFISKNDQIIDLNEVYKFYKSYKNLYKKDILEKTLVEFSWDSITKDIIRNLNNI